MINEKREDPEDLEYWIDYVFEVGVEHFRSTHFHKMTFYEYLDLDICLILYVLDILAVYSMLKIFARFYRKFKNLPKT